MDQDTKRQSSRVVGWFCLVFAVVLVAYALWLSGRGGEGAGMLLVVALALVAVGVGAIAAARRPQP
jgi:apolipoprotein N-acyltransferase